MFRTKWRRIPNVVPRIHCTRSLLTFCLQFLCANRIYTQFNAISFLFVIPARIRTMFITSDIFIAFPLQSIKGAPYYVGAAQTLPRGMYSDRNKNIIGKLVICVILYLNFGMYEFSIGKRLLLYCLEGKEMTTKMYILDILSLENIWRKCMIFGCGQFAWKTFSTIILLENSSFPLNSVHIFEFYKNFKIFHYCVIFSLDKILEISYVLLRSAWFVRYFHENWFF